MNLLRRNVVFLLLSQLATFLISIVLLVVAPDRLGPEKFGRIGLSIAYIGFFTLVGSLGTYQYMVKRIARDHGEVAVLVTTALRFKVLLGATLSIAAVGLTFVIGYDTEVKVLIAISCGQMMLTLLNEMVVAGLAGMERLARAAVWQTAQVYIGSIGAIVVVLTTESTVMYVTAISLSWLIPALANYQRLRPVLRGPREGVPGVWKALLVGGIPMFVLQVFNLTYSTIDVPLLEWLSGTEVVGWYSLAYRWVGMPIFITNIVVTAFLPRLATLAHQPEPFSALVNQAVRLVLVVNIPLAVGLALVSGDLVGLLYGSDYDSSIMLIRLLAPFIPLVGLNTVLATGLVAADRHLRYLWVAGGAALINPPIAILVIRWADRRFDNGAQGAAVLTVVTEIVITAFAIRMRTRGSTDRETVLYTLRCLVAAGLMVPAVWLVDDFGVFVEAAVGGVAYVAASVALRTLSWSMVRDTLADVKASRFGTPSLVGEGLPAVESDSDP